MKTRSSLDARFLPMSEIPADSTLIISSYFIHKGRTGQAGQNDKKNPTGYFYSRYWSHSPLRVPMQLDKTTQFRLQSFWHTRLWKNGGLLSDPQVGDHPQRIA